MNIKSAELLQGALQNAAENALRNREVLQSGQLEAQRIAVENAFRQAQLEHYNQMENRQQGFYNKMQQAEEDRALLGEENVARQQQQNGLAQSQQILKVAMQLNATGQLSDKGREGVNDWLSRDANMSKSGIQLTAPANGANDPVHTATALRDWVNLREQWQGRVNSATDPAQKAEAQQTLDGIDAYVLGKSAGRMAARDGDGSGAGAGAGSAASSQGRSQRTADEQEQQSEGQEANNVTAQGPDAFGFMTGGKYDPNAPTATLTPSDLTPVTKPAPVTGIGVAAPSSNGLPTGRLIQDNSGTTWNYTGNAADPRTDLNPANWQQAQQAK